MAAIDRRRETTVTLPAPIPVHVQYWTAWVDQNGVVNFRRDLYGRDTVVQAALAARPPGV
jgi:murein L,D-transpeptidase YcbB/YkuD